jgi:hypothetical protein
MKNNVMGWEIDEVTKDFIRQSGWYDPEPSKEERANKVVIEISKKILSNAEDLDDCIFLVKSYMIWQLFLKRLAIEYQGELLDMMI